MRLEFFFPNLSSYFFYQSEFPKQAHSLVIVWPICLSKEAHLVCSPGSEEEMIFFFFQHKNK